MTARSDAARVLDEAGDKAMHLFNSWSDAFASALENSTVSIETHDMHTSYSTRGESESIRELDFSKKRLSQNIKDLAFMDAVYTVDKAKLNRTGKRPTDIFAEYFDSWGNALYSDELGAISVKKSSIKSEIRHGITAEKIASIEAIPTVLKEGKVIFAETKTGSDVKRIVVGAPISIGTSHYYMGVMLQRDTQHQRLYLHNV